MKAPSHLLGSQLSLPLHPPERRRDFQNSAPGARGPSEAAVPTSKHTGATRGSAAAGRCGGPTPWGTDGQPALGTCPRGSLFSLLGVPAHPDRGLSFGVWPVTLNFHYPAVFPHPSPQPRTIPARPDPLPRVHSLPTVLRGRACGVLSFSPAPASRGFSDILETSWSRPDACGGGYTLFGPRQCWVHVLPAQAVRPWGDLRTAPSFRFFMGRTRR